MENIHSLVNYHNLKYRKKTLMSMQGHSDLIRSVDLNPNWLVSGSWDGSVRLWDRKNGNFIEVSIVYKTSFSIECSF